MEMYGQDALKNAEPSECNPAGTEHALKGKINAEPKKEEVWGREVYPERVGVRDCNHYSRTGLCGYGNICRYNHTPLPHQVRREVQLEPGEYPKRVGKPACPYYLRMGRCKFGASCKFDHPRCLDAVPLNVYGFPLRPEIVACSYYLKTGQCKYGITCIFHHPQLAGIPIPTAACPFIPTVQTLSVLSTEQHGGLPTSFRPLGPSVLPGSYVPGVYGPMMYHHGVLPLTNWSPYSVKSALATSATTLSQTCPPLVPWSVLAGSLQEEALIPKRPAQPECQFYMKTGNCKFGSSCKYHHPPKVIQSKMNCSLSPLGLPMRPFWAFVQV